MGEICNKVEKIKWNLVDKGLQFIYVDLSSVDISTHKISSDYVINNSTAPSRAQQIVKTNDILFGTTRPTLMRYCMIPNSLNGQICSTGYCVIRANTNHVLARWLFYMISSKTFFEYVNSRQQGAGYPSISDKQIFLFEVPIPPLSEQERIVNILDRFEALTTDLQSGLPAEIAARRKQYEYYREKLLTFKRKTA